MLVCAAHHLLQIGERQQGDESHRIGTHHAERRELVLLVVFGGHHAEQRTVRHVDSGIDHHHHQVERVGPDTLAHRPELWGVEQ